MLVCPFSPDRFLELYKLYQAQALDIEPYKLFVIALFSTRPGDLIDLFSFVSNFDQQPHRAVD
jgi:hypothetical protein